MNIFQNIHNQSKLDNIRIALENILSFYDAKEVYYMEFDEFSSFCVKHIGNDKDCSNFHKSLADKLERVAFEENIPVVILDTSKDPRTANSPLSKKAFSVLVYPVKNKGLPLGTITVIREKVFDLKDLHDLNHFSEKLALLINTDLYSLDRKGIVREIAYWVFERFGLKKDDFPINNLLNFLSNLGLDLKVSFLFEDGSAYNNLPCDINNWKVILDICPAIKKNKPINCATCRFSKVKGFICRRVSLSNKLPIAVFSFSDFSFDSDESWNESIINVFSKMALWFYSMNKLDYVFLYSFIFDIIKDLGKSEKLTIDNAIVKIVDVLFSLWNNAAVYAYSANSKSKFEFIRINPKYNSYTDIIYNYCKGNWNFSSTLNGTFSFIIKNKNESIVFDIIFINLVEGKKNISGEITVVKNFFDFVVSIDFIFDHYTTELKEKKDEIKSLYNRTKKLEQEISIYQDKMINLENKLFTYKLKEEFNRYVNSLFTIDDFVKKMDGLMKVIDSFISYRVASSVVVFFNKIMNKFDFIHFWNIPEYLQDSIKYKLKTIEKEENLSDIINFFSELRIIHSSDEEFSYLSNFFMLKNVRSFVFIPLFFSEEKLGGLLIFFNSKIDLSNEEKSILSSISKELSRRLRIIKNNETLEKIKYVYALIQEFLEKLHFQHNLTINQIFEYLFIIISKIGFKTILAYRENKYFVLSSEREFSLEYFKSEDTEQLSYPSTLSIPREILASFEKIMIFQKEQYDEKFSFINPFFLDNNQILFLIPFSNVLYSQLSYEYSNFFVIVITDNITYSQFDIQVFSLIQKMLSMIYNNMFLYYLNFKDKKILSEVFEVMEDGIIVADLEKKILLINKSAIKILEINQNPEDIINRRYSFKDLLWDKSGEIIQKIINIEELINKYIKEGVDGIEGEATFESDEKTKIIKYSFSILQFPIYHTGFLLDSSDSFNYLIVLRDITEQKNVEKEKDDFVATISHDIKTPLTTMKGYLSALLRYSDKITPEQRDSYLRVINSEIDRINRMLNNLMDLRRLEGNILKINPVKFDVVKVVNKVIDIFRISYVNFEFSIKSSESSVLVYADKDKIEQVLHNLLSNAVKYSPTGGKVSVNVEKKLDEVWIQVSDQGMGIPENELDKIFEKYYRTKSSHTKKVSGKGLGLYITKKIIELHGGKVWVKSEINKGTTFGFSIPL